MPASKHRTVRRLTYFAAIARAGTIRAAARELGVSVPVLSSALSELEAELGLTLATRSTRSFQLTSAGEAVYARAQSILSQLDSVLTLATTDRRLDGQLGITLPIELTASWLPERLARYRSEHPNVSISIDARDEVVELRDSAIDIAVRVNFLDTDDGNNTDPGIDRDITQPVQTRKRHLSCRSAVSYLSGKPGVDSGNINDNQYPSRCTRQFTDYRQQSSVCTCTGQSWPRLHADDNVRGPRLSRCRSAGTDVSGALLRRYKYRCECLCSSKRIATNPVIWSHNSSGYNCRRERLTHEHSQKYPVYYV